MLEREDLLQDEFLATLVDPHSHQLDGDPGLGDAPRWIRLGVVDVPEPTRLIVAEPGGGGDRIHVPVGAGAWSVEVLRVWGDRWVRTTTMEVRLGLEARGGDEPWPWYDQWRDALIDGPAGVEAVDGHVDIDGGVIVAAFESLAASTSLTEEIEFLDEVMPNWSPRITPAGVFSPAPFESTDVKARMVDGYATEVRLRLFDLTGTLEAHLRTTRAERSRFDGYQAVTEASGGYQVPTGTCMCCGLPGTVMLPLLSLLRMRGGWMRDKALEGFDVSEEARFQAATGIHPGCRQRASEQRVGGS